jgi:hypothetical protein
LTTKKIHPFTVHHLLPILSINTSIGFLGKVCILFSEACLLLQSFIWIFDLPIAGDNKDPDQAVSGEKFRTVPDHMVGLMPQPVSIFINPLPRLFNSKQFAYLCKMDQVSAEQEREVKKDDLHLRAFSAMDSTAMLTV